MLDARQVAECGHEGHGHGERPAAQGLTGLDHRRQAPGVDLFLPYLYEALEPFGVRWDRADTCLHDEGCRTQSSRARELGWSTIKP
jgi:hypothetical protein